MQAHRALVLLVLGFLAACAGSAVQRTDKAIRVALEATNAARDSFVAWDQRHQEWLVDRAETREAAEADLTAYRERRQAVVQAFTAAYASIAAAASLVPLVNKGSRSQTDLLVAALEVARAVEEVKRAIDQIRGSP